MAAVVVQLLEEILHHMGCEKNSHKYWDKLPTSINWCRSSSINSSGGSCGSSSCGIFLWLPAASCAPSDYHRPSKTPPLLCEKSGNPTGGVQTAGHISLSSRVYGATIYVGKRIFRDLGGVPLQNYLFWGDLGALVATICLDMYSRFKMWEASN